MTVLKSIKAEARCRDLWAWNPSYIFLSVIGHLCSAPPLGCNLYMIV